MSEWQPIETAPKDGTEIDLWATCRPGDAGRVADCKFQNGRWLYFSECEEHPKYIDGFVPLPEGLIPTHWMPRPGAPSD